MKTPNDGKCEVCTNSLKGKRPDARYCSPHCYNIRKRCPDKERACKQCSTMFPVVDYRDANRRYCTAACSKKAHTKIARDWREANPTHRTEYQTNYLTKNPGAWTERSRKGRAESLRLLGGKCCAGDCKVTNPYWLHIDFIPTTRGSSYRHPRGVAYIRRNLSLFRLLCANHHYELTLTGKIEGTDITQLRLVPSGERRSVAA